MTNNPAENHFVEEENQPESTGQGSRPSPTLGEYLKAEREEKGIDIKLISQQTKISSSQLEFLEGDRYEYLPQKAYIIGFTKSYAKATGLDEKKCLSLLQETYQFFVNEDESDPHLNTLQAQRPVVKTKDFNPNGIPTGKLVKAGAVIVVLFVASLFVVINQDEETVIKPANDPVKPMKVTADSPLKMGQPKIKINPAKPVTTENSQEEKPEVKPQKVDESKKVDLVESQDIVETDLVNESEEKTEEKKVNLRQIGGPLFSTLNTSQDELDAVVPAEYQVSPASGEHVIFISASNGDTWLTYKSDNDQIKKFVLKQGKKLFIRAKETRAFFGNINAVEIFYNNEKIDIDSKTGVKSLVFPPESSTKFSLPLFIYEKSGKTITSDELPSERIAQ